MKINRSDLYEALEIVKPGLANKELIEQSTSFAFLNGTVVTYNDEISISHPLGMSNLTGAIPAEALYKFLGKLKSDSIELELTENEILIVSERSRAGLTLQSEIRLPLTETLLSELGAWHKLPDKFIEYLGEAMTACGRDSSQPKLNNVHVCRDGLLEASDGYRIAHYMVGQELPVEEFLIPAMSAAEVVKLKPTYIAEGNGWVHFKTENETIISARTVANDADDPYPNIAQHIRVKGIEIKLPETTEEVLDRAMIFAKRIHALDESVTITIKDRRCSIEAAADCGWFKEEINMAYKGEVISFEVTPYLLKETLKKKTYKCIVSKDKIKLEGPDWFYVLVLREME